MTDVPPPRPTNEPGDEPEPTTPPTEPIGTSEPSETTPLRTDGVPAPGEQYPGLPRGGWTPVAPASPQGGRVRRWGTRLRANRVVVAIVGVLVAAGLVLTGFALADGGHDGKDGRGAVGQRGDGGSDRHNGNAADDNRAGRGDRDRTTRGDDDSNNGRNRDANDDTDDDNSGGARQDVLGTVTAVSATSITVRTSGGTPSYPITATTPVTRSGAAASVGDLKVGDAVVLRVTTANGNAPVVLRITVG